MYKLMFKPVSFLILICFTLSVAGAGLPGAQKHKEASRKILSIGDSNGALPDGWVNQLKKLLPCDSIMNISISGNTIGFDNNGRKSLNTLRNISSYMDKGYARLGKIDIIIFMIGTNDCKSVFGDSAQSVAGNMKKIISFVSQSLRQHHSKAAIFIVSPPPFGPDELVGEKYAGGLDRVTRLNSELQSLAEEEKIYFIDTFHILLPVFRSLTIDGVHLTSDGQLIIARIIDENLKFISVTR